MKGEILQGYMKGKKRRNKERNHASSEEVQGEIHLSCWSLPSDFFLDASLVFYQLRDPGWVVQLLARPLVTLSPASRENFY